MKKGPIL